jgi:hypothetical protein
MKHRKLTSALVATGLLFPIAAFGQTTGTGQTAQQDRERQQQTQRDTQTTMGQTATQTQRDTQQRQTGAAATTGQQRQTGATATTGTATTQQRDTFGTQQRDTLGHAGISAAGAGQIRRIERGDLDNKPTANNLTGKNVVGSDGERVGTVHDIGLSSVLPSDLQNVQDQGMFGRNRDDQRTATGTAQTTGTTRAGGDTTGTTRTAQARVGDQTYSATMQTDGQDQFGLGLQQENEVTIYVSVGGVLGLGANIVGIPASQFTYDTENDELRLNQPSAEIERIADGEARRAGAAAE